MFDFKILANKVFSALIVCAVLVAFLTFGPVEIKQSTTAAVVMIVAAVGTATVNDLQTYKANKKKERDATAASE